VERHVGPAINEFPDQGRNQGSIGAQPAAFASAGADLYAALPDGTIKRTSDAGRTWTIRSTP
jgi:hypothetical protein